MHLYLHVFLIRTFANLRYLNMGPNLFWFQYLSFETSPTINSSTLLELHVSLTSFWDCLYLLDGRFNQLRTLHVNLDCIHPSRLIIDNKVDHFA
jgi:hypothetical protein